MLLVRSTSGLALAPRYPWSALGISTHGSLWVCLSETSHGMVQKIHIDYLK
jgi:hypothetical protein